jgi:hypothetical protein
MSDELQLSGWDTTRALCESSPIDREIRLNTGADDDSKVEFVLPYSPNTTTEYHWPSEERLATAISGFSTSESINSGAEIIGVKDNSWSNLTGDTDLQSVLDDLDTLFDNIVLNDGTVAMNGDWNVNNELVMTKSVSSEMLADTGFADVGVSGKWQVSGQVTDGTNKLTYTQGGTDTGYFLQTAYDGGSGNMLSDVVQYKTYYLQFVVSNWSGTGKVSALISGSLVGGMGGSYKSLISGNGTQKVFFKATSASLSSVQDFKLTITTKEGTSFSFDIDDITLKRVDCVLKPYMLDVGNIVMGKTKIENDIDGDNSLNGCNIVLDQCSLFQIIGYDGVSMLSTDGDSGLYLFSSAYEGRTPSFKIYGRRSGDTIRSLNIGISASEDNAGIIDNVSMLKIDADLYLQSVLATKTVDNQISTDKDTNLDTDIASLIVVTNDGTGNPATNYTCGMKAGAYDGHRVTICVLDLYSIELDPTTPSSASIEFKTGSVKAISGLDSVDFFWDDSDSKWIEL